MINKKQKILAILGLGLVLFLLFGNTGKIYAQQDNLAATSDSSNPILKGLDWASGLVASPLTVTVMGISYIAGVLASIAVQIGGFLSNFAISLNFAVLQNPLIDVGWKITRDLANLGFVLFIIIIAVATILRMQQYGAKSALGKLIAVALLVNFSLVFAGVFIDFSNMLTNFFISNITGAGIGGLGTSLAAAFNVGQFMGINNLGDALKVFEFSGALKIIAGLIFAVVFTLLVALCLIAVAAMFILRYLNLSALLVLAPLACLFIILPATESIWKEWWKNFIKWIIFAPAASFFFYLAVYLANNLKAFTSGISLDAQGVGKLNDIIKFGGTPMQDMAGSVINLVIVGGFLMFGLVISDKMGIGGAKTFLNVASTAGKWIRGRIRDTAIGTASFPLRTAPGRKLVEGMQKMPGFRRLGTALSSVGVEQGARMAKQAEERINKRFASDRNAALALPTLNWEERLAVVKRLMKNKTMNLMEEKDINALIGDKATETNFARLGAKNVYDDFEKATGRNRAMVETKDPEAKARAAEEFHKTFNPKDYDNIRAKAFTDDKEFIDANIAGILHANPGALSKLMPKFSANNFDKFNKRFKQIFDKEIDEAIKSIDQGIDIGGAIGVETEKKLDWLRAKKSESYNKFKMAHDAQTKTLARRAMGFEEIPPIQI